MQNGAPVGAPPAGESQTAVKAVFGFLNLYKPTGMSSYDVVRRVRRRVGRRVKVGHAGTLDPLAEGVLVVCLGPATCLVELLHRHEKEYVVTAELGAVSSTGDAEGEIERSSGASPPSVEAVAEAAREFVGTIQQVPPAHSAVKVAGRRAYQLARGGKDVPLAAREVTVHSLTVLRYDWPELRLRICCGSGTYVRSLVGDLGRRLGSGGYCTQIIRTRVGPFRAETAARMDDLDAVDVERLLIPATRALATEARIPLTDAQVRELSFGRAVPLPALAVSARKCDPLGAVDSRGRLVALVRLDEAANALRPVKVLIQRAP